MRRPLVLAAALVAGVPAWGALAQQPAGDAPQQRPPAPPSAAGQSDAGADPANADNMGSTGWTGSWTANEGDQQDDPGTATTDRTKPMPAVPPAKSPDP